jgi:hypothetical protein
MAMDDLDRIFRRLVHQLRSRYPQYLSRPFEAEEVYQVIVPYRHHRQELGIETNQDYETAVMRLLAGERGYLTVDREMRDALSRELESANPDTSLFRVYSNHRVSVAQEALDQVETVGRTDDARLAAVPASDGRRSRASRPTVSVEDDGFDASASSRSRVGSFGASAPTVGGPSTPGGTPRFDGMPLPPSSLGRSASSRAIDEAIPPAPPRTTSPERLAPSVAPSTSPPAGRATGLTGHGSRVPQGGIGTPPSYPEGDRTGNGSAQSAGSVASRRENSGAVAPSSAAGARAPFTQSPGSAMASSRRSVTADAIGGQCRYCTGALPEGRQITFCPHCGQDLTVQQCPACSTELELGWKFCTTCGRSVGQA